jgi:hypothetical protein
VGVLETGPVNADAMSAWVNPGGEADGVGESSVVRSTGCPQEGQSTVQSVSDRANSSRVSQAAQRHLAKVSSPMERPLQQNPLRWQLSVSLPETVRSIDTVHGVPLFSR